ncbi:TIGR03084 family protein [Streptomyces sedi]|uniref:TIGR03084 family protein n=1 Tax=Streptomyces sedi TaxID=555059 RepID=A0A5C4VHU9_9ACTN|nr:TIGR03084 family protein [Streptomyces sedi]
MYAALTAESEEIDALVAELDEHQWALPTPAAGWTIADQIAHLAFIARIAAAAATDVERFEALAAPARVDFQSAIDAALAEHRRDTPAANLACWRAEREVATRGLAAKPADSVVPWLVNPLPPAVLASAGMMEVFAHGQDIADALAIRRAPTDRIAPLVAFGVRTRDFAYLAQGIKPPAEEFRFELTAPSGQLWAFGPEDAEQRVTGTAHDFCLLVARRRHATDLSLEANGVAATAWLEIAQAYRGPAGDGRRPGQFAPVPG